jgi:hypothetical protein
MDDLIKQYITAQPNEWQTLLTNIHAIIVKEDPTITPIMEPMMGKEMILYKAKGMMKYGLAATKKYMSLHCLPIYMNSVLSDKYKRLLVKANFQKGCINFSTADEMPAPIVKNLIADCSAIDLLKIREEQLQERKLKARAKKKS